MMRSTLSDIEIAGIEMMVETEMAAKLRTTRDAERYAFGGEFLGSLVRQVVIPILVSLSSRGLYDVLKGRILGHLGKKEVDALKAELRNEDIPPGGAAISPECLDVLKAQLGPLGFTEAEIKTLYEAAKSKLAVQLPGDPHAKTATQDT